MYLQAGYLRGLNFDLDFLRLWNGPQDFLFFAAINAMCLARDIFPTMKSRTASDKHATALFFVRNAQNVIAARNPSYVKTE